jgi:hypothetical protein
VTSHRLRGAMPRGSFRDAGLADNELGQNPPPRIAIEMLRTVLIKKYSAKRTDLHFG